MENVKSSVSICVNYCFGLVASLRAVILHIAPASRMNGMILFVQVRLYYPLGGLRAWNVAVSGDLAVQLSGHRFAPFMGRCGACTQSPAIGDFLQQTPSLELPLN